MFAFRPFTCALAVALSAGLEAASAAPRPNPQHAISRGAVTRVPARAPIVKPAHWRFGTIQTLGATTFTMLTRTGRVITVDDTVPLQSGIYSFPLYVGKAIVVDGTFDKTGTMHATNIVRAIRIDRFTPPDQT